MREVVVTGIGIVSSIGNNVAEVTNSLHSLKSGISHNDINAELGLRSHVSGSIKNLDCKELIDRKLYRFMGESAAYAYLWDRRTQVLHAGVSYVNYGSFDGSFGMENGSVNDL